TRIFGSAQPSGPAREPADKTEGRLRVVSMLGAIVTRAAKAAWNAWPEVNHGMTTKLATVGDQKTRGLALRHAWAKIMDQIRDAAAAERRGVFAKANHLGLEDAAQTVLRIH